MCSRSQQSGPSKPASGQRRRRQAWTLAMIAAPMTAWLKLSTSWGSSLLNSTLSFDAVDRGLANNFTNGGISTLGAADDKEAGRNIVIKPREPLDQSNKGGGILRIDWSNLELKTDLAKEIHQHMQNCSLPRAKYEWRIHLETGHNFGLGSELHTFQTVLVAGMDHGYRPQAVGHWDWYDKKACDGSRTTLSCYFPDLEPDCPNEALTDEEISKAGCLNFGTKRFYGRAQNLAQQVRPALTEAMFSSLSPLVLSEAERQLNKVFPNGVVPPNLITVHVRWGDKVREMPLLDIGEYVKKTHDMVANHKLSPVHILLCTEDPAAVDAFKQLVPPDWNVYLDHFYVEYAPYRGNSSYNVASNVSVSLDGKAGLWALASALVAVEANYYVLTIKSNWSRLINELRQIVEARINSTTFMTNLGQDYDC